MGFSFLERRWRNKEKRGVGDGVLGLFILKEVEEVEKWVSKRSGIFFFLVLVFTLVVRSINGGGIEKELCVLVRVIGYGNEGI